MAGVAVVAVAGLVTALIVSSAGKASPKPKPVLPEFSITAQSAMTPVNGVVWTRYGESNRSAAQIEGDVTHVTRGETAQLYAQPFPFRAAPSPVGPPVSLHPTGQAKTASYSFQVIPNLATRYRVEVFPDGSARRPLASSRATTIYVDGGWVTLRAAGPCARPVCHETVVGEVLVAPSALSSEMAKPVLVYSGLSLNGSPPSTLQLGGDDAHVTMKQLATNGYEETITFTLPVGNSSNYTWLWNACAIDTAGEDGMGLPGPHLCSEQTVPGSFTYLGFS